MRQEELWLDQCRPDQIIGSLTVDLENSEQETRSEMRGRRPSLTAARDEVTRFRVKHGLDEDVNHGKAIDSTVVAQLGLVLVAEFLVNASYQSTFVKDGLVGGVVIAFGASCTFALLGIGLGLGLQLRAKATGGKWLGYAVIAAVIAAAAWLISLLSLARVAGERSDPEPYRTAGAQLWADWTAGLQAMTDLVAFVFAIVSLGVILFVAYKFMGYAGGYIGLRKRGLTLEYEQGQVQQLFDDAKSEVKTISERYKLQLDKAPDFIVQCKAPIRSLIVDHENAVDQFRGDSQDLEHAARLFDAYIRENGGPPSDHLRDRMRDHLQPHLKQLEQQHAAFVQQAEALCAREDVNDKTVAEARSRFTRVIERIQSALNDLIGHAPLPPAGSPGSSASSDTSRPVSPSTSSAKSPYITVRPGSGANR